MDKSEKMSGYRRRAVGQYSIRKMFLVATIFGSLGITIGFLVGSQWLAIILPLLVVFAYIFVTQKLDIDLPNSVIGDSYYYLGFILTLISLTVSLVALTDDDVNIAKIVGSFGAAMLTTVLGLIARLIITTFSIESEERRERLEQEIELSLDRFLGQVNTMTERVSADMVKMSAQINTALMESTEQYRANSSLLEQNAKSVDASLKQCIDAFTRRVNQIRVGPEAFEDAIKGALSGFTKEMQKLSESYAVLVSDLSGSNAIFTQTMKTNQNEFVSHHKKFSDDLSEVLSKQAIAHESALAEISKSILGSFGEVKDLKMKSEEALEDIRNQLVLDANKSKTVIDSLLWSYTQIEKIVKDVEASFDGHDKRLDLHNKLLESERNRLEESDKLIGALVEKLGLAANNLNDFSQHFSALDRNIGKLSETIIESSNDVKGLSDMVSSDVAHVYKELSLSIKKLNSD